MVKPYWTSPHTLHRVVLFLVTWNRSAMASSGSVKNLNDMFASFSGLDSDDTE